LHGFVWEDKFERESDKGFKIIILIAKDVIYSRLPRTHGNALDEKQNNTGGGAKHDFKLESCLAQPPVLFCIKYKSTH